MPSKDASQQTCKKNWYRFTFYPLTRSCPNGKRILVVDDDEDICNFLQEVLQSWNYPADTASNGIPAIELLGKHTYAAVISGLNMPGMNGLDFLSYVRTNYPTLPFIMMSAYSTIKSRDEALKGGANAFLSKPFNKEELKRLLGGIF